jgi:hypothetical protein
MILSSARKEEKKEKTNKSSATYVNKSIEKVLAIKLRYKIWMFESIIDTNKFLFKLLQQSIVPLSIQGCLFVFFKTNLTNVI